MLNKIPFPKCTEKKSNRLKRAKKVKWLSYGLQCSRHTKLIHTIRNFMVCSFVRVLLLVLVCYTRSYSVSNQFPNGLFSLSLSICFLSSYLFCSVSHWLSTHFLSVLPRESLSLHHIHRNHIDTIRMRLCQCISEHVGWYSRLWRRL